MVEGFHLEGLVAVRAFLTHALARRQRDNLIGGEAPLSQNVEHFAPNIAGGTHHGDLVTHC